MCRTLAAVLHLTVVVGRESPWCLKTPLTYRRAAEAVTPVQRAEAQRQAADWQAGK